MIDNRESQLNEWLNQGFYGVLPIYGEDGSNASLILLEGRPPVVNKLRVKTIIADIAKFHQKDISLVRKQAREIAGQRTMNALPVSYVFILVPFKVRRPIGKDDGAVGYICDHAIKDITFLQGKCVVVLNDEQKIDVLENISTIKRRLCNTRNIRRYVVSYYREEDKIYKRKNYDNIGKDELAVREVQACYDQPATKADIAMLSMNIMNLMDKLRL